FSGEGFVDFCGIWRGLLIYVVNVYSPCLTPKKQMFWRDLEDCKSRFPVEEWCVGVILMLLGLKIPLDKITKKAPGT
ncbi:hypothetical protein RYX36_028581, partial [Vicia faba]